MSDDLAVQGPTSNVSMSEMTASELSGMSSPVSSLERNSPVSSLPDTNGVDLNEVLKVSIYFYFSLVKQTFSQDKIQMFN